MCPRSLLSSETSLPSEQNSTQHSQTQMWSFGFGTVKGINRLAPRRPDLIFTTARMTPKYFYIAREWCEGRRCEKNIFETMTTVEQQQQHQPQPPHHEAISGQWCNCNSLSCWIFFLISLVEFTFLTPPGRVVCAIFDGEAQKSCHWEGWNNDEKSFKAFLRWKLSRLFRFPLWMFTGFSGLSGLNECQGRDGSFGWDSI